MLSNHVRNGFNMTRLNNTIKKDFKLEKVKDPTTCYVSTGDILYIQ